MFDSAMHMRATQTIKDAALMGRKIGSTLLGPKQPGATGGVSKPKAARKAQRKARKATKHR